MVQAMRRFRPPSKREKAIKIAAAMSLYDPIGNHPMTLRAQTAIPKLGKRAKPRTDPTEHQEQVTVIKWWALKCRGYSLPNFALMAIPNGGARDPITGSRLKAEGVRRGAPDLFLAVPMGADSPSDRPFHGLLLEMKRKDGTVKPEQKIMLQYLQSQRYKAVVCWSAQEAINEIVCYLEVPF